MGRHRHAIGTSASAQVHVNRHVHRQRRWTWKCFCVGVHSSSGVGKFSGFPRNEPTHLVSSPNTPGTITEHIIEQTFPNSEQAYDWVRVVPGYSGCIRSIAISRSSDARLNLHRETITTHALVDLASSRPHNVRQTGMSSGPVDPFGCEKQQYILYRSIPGKIRPSLLQYTNTRPLQPLGLTAHRHSFP